MNIKSNILKITIVLALIFMLVPVIAAEDVDDAVYTESVDEDIWISEDVAADDSLAADDDADDEVDDEADDEEIDDETYGGEEGDIAYMADSDESADLQITLISNAKHVKPGDLANFGIIVANYGLDTAHNVKINFAFYTGDVFALTGSATKGVYDIARGIWIIDELAPGEVAALAFKGLVLSNKDLILVASVISDTPDPDLSNNIAMLFIKNVGGQIADVSAAEDTLPATGNPIMLALLALISLAGACLGRRF